MMTKKEIGILIREKRKDKGYTLNQIAEMLKVTPQLIWQWEKGIVELKATTL